MIGRVIDKYKIVEEVGQGGMSVVYKGMDTSLNREVAVKVLHPHLASSDEARMRFEREAHAVAKLRHENILEIYDYSGRDSPDSYIVTELIRGRTLRSFIGDHPLAFPEIAAMIVVEVCRALAHAHTLGVLHRDVKPENIMIREDGVLKLMDFGIAQIVDSQRMTVTGQLLGSPAYMSPEHVEGRPLDYRTDVFSVGILLYQLATGELPFKGRNPHEILKRIADCRYLDARVVNPLVADRLNRVVSRALARLPEDRFADVALMIDELQRFLAEAELTDPRSELKRFFAKPLPYEQALRQRLVAALTRGGRTELAAKRTARALDMWNRVLTIDPSNDEVLKLIDRLSRRRRATLVAVGAAVVAVVGAGGLFLYRELDAKELATPAPVAVRPPAPAPAPAPTPAVAPAPVPPPAPAPVAAIADGTPDAGTLEVTVAPEPPVRPEPTHPRHEPAVVKPEPLPSHPALVPATRTFRVVPTPRNAWYSLDKGPFEQVSMGGIEIPVGPGAHTITLRHPLCDDDVLTISGGDQAKLFVPHLQFKPTRVKVLCDRPGVNISVNDKPSANGALLDVIDFGQNGKSEVKIDFMGGGLSVHKSETVTAGNPTKVVSCDDG